MSLSHSLSMVPHHFNDPIEHSLHGSSQIIQQGVSNMGKRKVI